MIITLDFLVERKACEEGLDWAINNALIGKEYSEGIRHAISLDRADIGGWLLDQKKSELYVRSIGSVFTMEYVVYDPLNGQNVRAKTLEEAKLLALESAKKVIETHNPKVGKILINENGDETYLGEDPTITELFTVVEK
jgi:hypothetical protein